MERGTSQHNLAELELLKRKDVFDDQLIWPLPIAEMDDPITCVINTYRQLVTSAPYTSLTIERIMGRQRIVLSVDSYVQFCDAGIPGKRKSPATVRRDKTRARKFRERKNGGMETSRPHPPPRP